MRNYFKTFFHCLFHLHRMSYYKPYGKTKREYFCECSERFKEVLDEWEELYGERPFNK